MTKRAKNIRVDGQNLQGVGTNFGGLWYGETLSYLVYYCQLAKRLRRSKRI